MNPIDNLQPCRDKTTAQERGRKGGIQSGVSKRKNKTLREIAKQYSTMPLTDVGVARLKRMGIKIDEKNPSALVGVFYGQMYSAINGNVKSAEWVQNLLDKNDNDTNGVQSFIDALKEDTTKDVSDIVEE